MKNFIKIKIKKFLNSKGWKLTKIYKNTTYTNQKPDLKLLEVIHACTGIIHLGGHRGTEASVYDWFNKKTIWIEANPKIYIDLSLNISQYINQIAFNHLISNKDDQEKDFFISNNDGASSSIFQFGKSVENLKMVKKEKLKTITLDTLLKNHSIDAKEYNFWVIDLQGSEYLALEGAKNSLKYCQSILIEISQDEYYVNGAKWKNIKKFLNENKFYNYIEPTSSHQDVLFLKK